MSCAYAAGTAGRFTNNLHASLATNLLSQEDDGQSLTSRGGTACCMDRDLKWGSLPFEGDTSQSQKLATSKHQACSWPRPL